MASILSIVKVGLHKELEAAAQRHTLTLQYEALLAGWPEELATKLEVIPRTDGALKISYPKYLENKINDYEYGNPDRPPSPVMRNYFTKIGVADAVHS